VENVMEVVRWPTWLDGIPAQPVAVRESSRLGIRRVTRAPIVAVWEERLTWLGTTNAPGAKARARSEEVFRSWRGISSRDLEESLVNEPFLTLKRSRNESQKGFPECDTVFFLYLYRDDARVSLRIKTSTPVAVLSHVCHSDFACIDKSPSAKGLQLQQMWLDRMGLATERATFTFGIRNDIYMPEV